MQWAIANICLRLQALAAQQEGQDLVEYALVISLVAVACVTGLSPLANAILTVFTTIEASL